VPPQIEARHAAGVDWTAALKDPEMLVTLQHGAA
jgi:hypothetical protein